MKNAVNVTLLVRRDLTLADLKSEIEAGWAARKSLRPETRRILRAAMGSRVILGGWLVFTRRRPSKCPLWGRLKVANEDRASGPV